VFIPVMFDTGTVLASETTEDKPLESPEEGHEEGLSRDTSSSGLTVSTAGESDDERLGSVGKESGVLGGVSGEAGAGCASVSPSLSEGCEAESGRAKNGSKDQMNQPRQETPSRHHHQQRDCLQVGWW
jgi:hypothetical protein